MYNTEFPHKTKLEGIEATSKDMLFHFLIKVANEKMHITHKIPLSEYTIKTLTKEEFENSLLQTLLFSKSNVVKVHNTFLYGKNVIVEENNRIVWYKPITKNLKRYRVY
ncbi:MAG: hypothetical protein HRT69_18710 [Flavobacteriaceae bacterium]|nr:hypothetical protein [Flavobacteriaceae bacterium]